MKTHTSQFKQELTQMGKQIDSKIIYTNSNNQEVTLHEELYAVTPMFEANLLKSVMKQLDIESSVDIPLGTVVNYQLGVKVGNNYEYLDYGNYVIYKSEKQEDTNTYKITCFDKMIYSMKDYEALNIIYPITIRNYINAICSKLGLTFANNTDTFANYNKEIQNELYLDSEGNSLGYTFRDVLDELAQVTASIICINKDDELEIRYINQTNDTIDENYIKDVNVKFGQKYGAINTIVLSRSAGADNIYYPSILPENPCEIKIEDNQIMNWDDRSSYLPDIYNKLNGLEYYINDFNSIGILYYDVGDMYNIEIGSKTYQCLMLNDEINVTSGIEEIIHTDMPEESVTDYKKADTSDKKIKKTILQVNKQEGKIEGIIEDIGDRSQKTTTITQDIDGINAKVQDIEDLTNTQEGTRIITLQNCVAGNLLELYIYGNNSVFDNLYPANDLYPDDNLYPMGDSRIEVISDSEEDPEVVTETIYELGITEVLRQNGNIKDEYVLKNGKAKVIRRINQDGTVKLNETIEDLGEFSIFLANGTNRIRIQNYSAPLKAKFAIKNNFTDIFATKVEMNSSITQTAEEINLEVSKKVDENEVISKINQSAEQIQINANKISLERKKY